MTVLFLGMRVVHVLLAAVWIGSAVFMMFMLMPAINATGPSGGQVMVALNRKGMPAFFGAISGITVLTGFYLYWRFTGGFDPGVSASTSGMVYGVGGVCGLLAAIIGGSVVGRGSKKIVELMLKAGPMPDGAEKRVLFEEAEALKSRITTAGALVIVLQVVAAGLMAIGHYV